MNMHTLAGRFASLIIGIILMAAAATHAAVITYVGEHYNFEARTDDPTVGWRNNNTDKPLDIDGNHIYGTDGYASLGGKTTTVVLPSGYISSIDRLAPNYSSAASFGLLDSPGTPSGTDTQVFGVWLKAGPITQDLLNLNIQGNALDGKILRVAIVFGLGNGSQTYTLAQTSGGTASASSAALTFYNSSTAGGSVDDNFDAAFFDLRNVVAGNVFRLTATSTSGNPHAGLLAFDTIALPTLYWNKDDTDVDWNTNDWGNGSTGWVDGGNATFDGTTGTVTITGEDADVSNITFSTSSTVAISTVSEAPKKLLFLAPGTITVAAGSTPTINTDVTGSFTKDGDGSLSLNGAVSGKVTVTEGTLKGEPTVGSLDVGATGTVAPGNSIGIIDVDSTATWAAGSTYEWEFTDPSAVPLSADLIDVTGGTLTLNGGATAINLEIRPFGTPSPVVVETDIFTLFYYQTGVGFASVDEQAIVNFLVSYPVNSQFFGGTPVIYTDDLGGGEWAIRITGFSYAIPEPSTAILAGLGLAGLTLRRRRRNA